jgi:transcriptional regulator with XRE-family HTH domain
LIGEDRLIEYKHLLPFAVNKCLQYSETNVDPKEPFRMTPAELERRQFRNEVRDHMAAIVSAGVTRQQLADALRVTKQAISSYMNRRTTPKPHVLRRLLARWPHTFKYRGTEFPPEAFGVEPGRINGVAKQEYLFDTLSSVKKENMRVEIERGPGAEAELRLIIKLRA